jgi:hypothetical protein
MSEGARESPVKQELSTSSATKEPNKKKKYDYNEQLKQDFGRLIEALTLTNPQKDYLRLRWLDQVLWMEGRAARARSAHYTLRLITIIGSVIVLILLGLDFNNRDFDSVLKKFTIVLSGVVAFSSAVEEFFHYGERWRRYKRTAESLKSQGWQFFELSSSYYRDKTHKEVFSIFASVVEDIIQHDVEVYATEVTHEKK